MITECKVENARACFAWRTPVNVITSLGGIFLVVYVGMHLFWALHVVDSRFGLVVIFSLVSIPVFIFVFFLLEKRAFRFVCPHCKGYIETNTPWKCGYCGCANYDVNDFPFIGKCESCGAEPKAYKCHHPKCRELIYFTKDFQDFNYAECINLPPAEQDDHEDAVIKRQKEIELKELAIKEGQLDVTLKSLRDSLQTPRMKTIEEKYRASMKNEDDERRLRAAINEEFKDDDVERIRRNLMIDHIMKDSRF